MFKSINFTYDLFTYVRHLSLVTFLIVMICIEDGCLTLLDSLDWCVIFLIAVQSKGCELTMIWVKNSLTDLTSMKLRGGFLGRIAIRFETVTTTVGSKVRQIISMLYMEITLPNLLILIHNFSLVIAVYEVWSIKYSLLSWLIKGCNATNAIFKFWNTLLMIKAHFQTPGKSYMVRKVARCFCSFFIKPVKSSISNNF